jgi:death-on-curing protein
VSDYVWVREDVALALHARQLAEHGGAEGVLRLDGLSAAMARPRHRLAYGNPVPDIAELAACYAFGIIENHPFADGNKRTAYVVARTFLLLNGLDIQATPVEKAIAFEQLASGELDEEGIASWLRDHLIQRPPALRGSD